ncbi:cytochrome P450 4C1-like [Tenebrio molitor]|uniref:cytochrome P450 4C1-like n=1 Tax=Tenebrio molitor TaxID=7067 RepID=UPI003624A0C5
MILLVLTWTIIVLVGLFVVKSLTHQFLIIKNVHRLPGPPSQNLLNGNIGPLYGSPESLFKTVRQWGLDYYPIYQNWVAHVAVANIMNPYDFETILSSSKHISKSQVYDMLHGWLGTGLLTSTGSKWQNRRKILTPSFHFNILQEFIKIFHEETERLVEVLKKECDKPFVDVTGYVSDFALNTIGETAMGTSFSEETANGKRYKDAIHQIGNLYSYRLLRPWFLNKYLYFFSPRYYTERKLVNVLHEFTTEVVAKREKNFKAIKQDASEDFVYSKRKRLAMLDLLLTAKKEDGSIDDEGIREEVDTFMFEGHDTTSAAICYALMLIACHPDVQERIVEEMHQVLAGSTKPDYRTLQELKYLERCLKEVLRLFPSVPFIARVLGEDMTTYSGHHLKAGTMIHLHIYDLHRNPDIYPDPEKFDPDRFLPENCQNRHNFAYVPFSAGPRNCIGQKFAMLEIKAVLCGVLAEFVLEPVDTPESLELKTELVLRSSGGVRVKFVPRKKSRQRDI